jgi:biotin carboxyl carrier protein
VVRRFTLVVEGEEYDIGMEGETITVDGLPFTVAYKDELVLVDGKAYSVELGDGQVIVDGIAYIFEVKGREKKPISRRREVEGESFVKAIMPGKIISVLVKEGDRVEEGEVVCVLEAMKMENELRSLRRGVVKRVLASTGSDVDMGEVLVVIG